MLRQGVPEVGAKVVQLLAERAKAEFAKAASSALLSCADRCGLLLARFAGAQIVSRARRDSMPDAASLLRGPEVGEQAVELRAVLAEAACWALSACCHEGGTGPTAQAVKLLSEPAEVASWSLPGCCDKGALEVAVQAVMLPPKLAKAAC